jgi:hypothetical protein
MKGVLCCCNGVNIYKTSNSNKSTLTTDTSGNLNLNASGGNVNITSTCVFNSQNLQDIVSPFNASALFYGGISIQKSLSVGFSTAGYGIKLNEGTLLKTYLESFGSPDATWTTGSSTCTVTMNIVKIGRQATLTLIQTAVANANSTINSPGSGYIPATYRPQSNSEFRCIVIRGNTKAEGLTSISTAGDIVVYYLIDQNFNNNSALSNTINSACNSFTYICAN